MFRPATRELWSCATAKNCGANPPGTTTTAEGTMVTTTSLTEMVVIEPKRYCWTGPALASPVMEYRQRAPP